MCNDREIYKINREKDDEKWQYNLYKKETTHNNIFCILFIVFFYDGLF